VHTLIGTLRRLSASLLLLPLASLALSIAALALPVAAMAATPITGVVTNRTTDKPSAGDTVALLRLVQGMQEVTSATTDSKGAFSLEAPDAGMYLVRVTHDKATYFGAVPAGSKTVNIDVYNAAAHVVGVSTEAIVMRAQTDASGSTLNVVENFFVKNDSKPAMTQFSNDPFSMYLPEGAVIEASAALAPGGMPVSATPMPVGEKGRYTFLFPIRPGETRFQVSYHVPYSGTLKFGLKVAGATDAFAVIVPKAMTFSPAPGTQFNPVPDDTNSQTFVARKMAAGQTVDFQVTGTGALPRETQTAGDQGSQGGQGGQAGQAAEGNGADAGASSDTAPGKGLGLPLDPNGTREPLSTKYKWWILGGLGLLLVAAAGVLLRKPADAHAFSAAHAVASDRARVLPTAGAVAGASAPATAAGRKELLLHVLKDELFALETDRLQGHIGEAEYAEQKAAIELVLRRALQGAGSSTGASA
jgi:hypothetical protein